ncbi:hypothetical protein CMI47_04575 [Candidatus Pacearchaeota archaeon]|nr:hypothetical protein [Candidatus Pacearchaeota archaeon]|tara:strand:- start:8034 stop:8813 length:780 start_codon:yes stop_codon:yes gene_type:complete
MARQRRKHKNEHVWVPDTQLRPGVPTEHIQACANYIVDRKPAVVVVAGDWYDLPSLSSYEKPGSKFFEGKNFMADVEFANHQWQEFHRTIRNKRGYAPRIIFLEGNHEYRMQRAINDDPVQLEGIMGRHLFLPYESTDVEYVPFLELKTVDGIIYSHYFANPQSLTRGVLGGGIDNRLNKLKTSFTQGHQQTLLTGSQFLPDGSRIRGLVAGAFYQHDEEYAGPQGHNYWRGICYKHEVRDGDYDLMEVSLNYLLREYQ